MKKTQRWAIAVTALASAVLFFGDTAAAPPDAACAAKPSAKQCGDKTYKDKCPDNCQFVEKLNKGNGDKVFVRPGKVDKPGSFKLDDFSSTKKELKYGSGFQNYKYKEYKPPANVKTEPKNPNSKINFGSSTNLFTGKKPKNSWAAQEKKAQVEAMLWNGAGTFERKHASNDPYAVGSCEDYVYKSFYDHERWLDAMYGAKGDIRKMVDISLKNQVPGLADHTLMGHRKAGTQSALFTLDASLLPGELPKNQFYSGTAYFFPEALKAAFAKADPKKAASVSSLVQTLTKEFRTYKLTGGDEDGKVHGPGGFESFADEWAYHRTLSKRTKNVSLGEFTEYEHRNADVQGAVYRYNHEIFCTSAMIDDNTSSIQMFVPGGACSDEPEPKAGSKIPSSIAKKDWGVNPQTSDMLGMGATLSHLNADGPANAAKAAGAAGKKLNAAPNSGSSKGSSPPIAVPGSNINFAASGHLQQSWTEFPPVIDKTSPYPRLKCERQGTARAVAKGLQVAEATKERFLGEYNACIAVNAVLDEWAKKESNKSSCFDKDNYACDWTPRMFIQHYVASNAGYGMGKPEKEVQRFKKTDAKDYSKEKLYRTCKAWKMFGDDSAPPPKGTVVATAAYKDVDAVNDAIAAKQKLVEEHVEKVGMIDTDLFGRQKSDQEEVGSGGFGAGYSYDMGYKVHIYERTKDKDVPCAYGGRLWAGFNAYAYAFDSDRFDIVDAGFNAYSADSSNKPKADKSHHIDTAGLNTHFDVVGYELWGYKKSVKLNQAIPLGNPKPLVSDEINIITIPFQVWWFTVTIKVDVGYAAGVMANVAATGTPPGMCDAKTKFGIEFNLAPYARLYLDASASVSLAGIAGVGIEVELILLDLSLPFFSSFSLNTQTQAFDFETGLDFDLETMAGSVSIFAEALFFEIASIELFSWNGFKYHTNLFKVKHSIPASVLMLPLKAPPSEYANN